MLVNGLARALIKNIPLEMGGADIMPCKADFFGLTDFPPADMTRWYCDFNDDVWDARKAFRMQWRTANIIRFVDCDEQAKYAVKCFTAKCLDDKIKFSTMHNHVRYVIRIINGALQECHDHKMLFITAPNILATMENSFTDINSQLYSVTTFKKFVQFVQKDLGGFPLVDVRELEKKAQSLSDIASLHHNQRHYPSIPQELFNGLITMFYDVLHDDGVYLNDRLTAGIMLIDSQVGLRKTELCALETDCLGYYLCDTGVNEPYVQYNCIKISRGDMEVVPVQTWCTDLCEQTINKYLELRERCIYSDQTDFLYILDPRGGIRDGLFPVDPQTLSSLYMRLCVKYAPDLVSRDWPNFNRVNVPGMRGEGKFSVPPIHCFRTTVASMAAMQGMPYDYIECAMAHDPNSEMGLGYYNGVEVPGPTGGRICIPADHLNAFDSFMDKFRTQNNK